MANFNKTIIIGKMTREAELRQTQSGKSVASFSVAVNRRFDKEKADFFNCVAWGQSGEFISKYGSKGADICIEGRMESRQYENKSGQKVTAWELVADNVQLLGKAKELGTAQKEDFEEIDDGELPF